MDATRRELDEELPRRIRARSRRLARMRERGASAARPACLSCALMALLAVLGIWRGIPTWVVALVALGGLGLVALGMWAARGRTVR